MKLFSAKSPRDGQAFHRGFSYIEVLLSVVLLVVLLVPAMQALNIGISGGAKNIAAKQLLLRTKVEEVLSKPYGQLYDATNDCANTPASISTSLSDASGLADRRVVVLYCYDTATNALSSANTGVIYVSVYFENTGSAGALNTLVGRWW